MTPTASAVAEHAVDSETTAAVVLQEHSAAENVHDDDGEPDAAIVAAAAAATSHRVVVHDSVTMTETSSPPRETSSGSYSFVNESGVLNPVPAVETRRMVEQEVRIDENDENEDVGDDDGHQHAPVVTAERIGANENDCNYAAESATVVGTIEDEEYVNCSDDAAIRKILMEDLISSGRSTEELQEYIRTASLENVVSRMSSETEAVRAEQATEEEKMEIVEPDSAIAWALHHEELASMASRNDEQVAVAAIPEEEATVVRITEHDVHPAEVESSDAHAELIGEDYTVQYDMPPPSEAAIAATSSTAAALATVETAQDQTTMDATVLDSKPAPVLAPWSEESTEEATVLETKPRAVDSWSRADEEAQEVTVDAVVEEEATVVDIAEDVHPAEFDEDDVQATFIGRDFTNTIAVDEHERVDVSATAEDEAVVVDIMEDVHPAEFEQNESRATLIGNGFARTTPPPRASSYSGMSTSRPTRTTRSVSDSPGHPIANPVDNITSSSFNRGIEALDELEQQNWMSSPSSFVEGDQVVLPPPPSAAAPPPMAQAAVLDEDAVSDNCSDVPPLPTRANGMEREQSRANSQYSEESERSIGTAGSGRRTAASLQLLSTAAVRGTNTMRRSTHSLMEVLFGESKQTQNGFDLDAAAGSILPRTLLPWSVFPKPDGTWVATVNTNQKALDSNNVREASRALRAFSCATQKQAEALARAWAPPRMLPFSDNPVCFICESKFAVFKRACHCRNCGVCVCSGCIVQWPSKMLPETYNIKRESLVNTCKSCDWLCSALRLALLNGQHDQAVAIHATGNVNLVSPFANVKGELFYPIHCAALGGNLNLLKWLVDDHCCPLRSLRVGGRRQSRGTYTPILTSRGRSLLLIAMQNRSLEIIRYLVADKNMSLADERHLLMETAIQVLEAALRRLPPDEPDGTMPHQPANNGADFIPTQIPSQQMSPAGSPVQVSTAPHEASPTVVGTSLNATASHEGVVGDDAASSGSVEDACIICFANTIDCVVTPCGHQICCMQCSTNITRCPVCSVDCSFIRVYKP